MYNVDGLKAAKGHKCLCSACIEDLHARDKLDRIELHRAAGAPQDWLDWWEARLKRGPLHRTGLPQHVWGEILARGLDAATEKVNRKAAEPKVLTDVERLTAELAALRAKVDGTATP